MYNVMLYSALRTFSWAGATATVAHRQIPTEVYRPRILTESVGRSGPWAAQPPVSRPLVARRRRDSNLGRSVDLVFSDSMPRVRSVGLGRLSYPHNGPSSHRKRKLHSQGSFTTRSDLGRTSVGPRSVGRTRSDRPTEVLNLYSTVSNCGGSSGPGAWVTRLTMHRFLKLSVPLIEPTSIYHLFWRPLSHSLHLAPRLEERSYLPYIWICLAIYGQPGQPPQ